MILCMYKCMNVYVCTYVYYAPLIYASIHTYIHTYISIKQAALLQHETRSSSKRNRQAGVCEGIVIVIIIIIIVLEVFLFSMNRHLESVFDRL